MSQDSQPLELAEALQRLAQMIRPIERAALTALSAAHGAIIAEDVLAPISLPPFPASAMDGYALMDADLQQDPTRAFDVVGQSLAGHPWDRELTSGQCVRIFTGAQMPAGADKVVLQEEVAQVQAQRVSFRPHSATESYVRPIGHDVKAGQLLAAAGTRLTPLVYGALTAAGVTEAVIRHRPTVGVFSTGDELVSAGTPASDLKPGQIYDSNRATVLQLLANGPFELLDLGLLPDDQHAVEAALQQAATRCDALITSGGVSVGDADFVTATIEKLGTLSFWRLNLKPGKPLAYGRIGRCHVFGLPGNPVSTIVTALLIAKPALLMLAGTTPPPPTRIRATLRDPLAHSPGRTEYQRGNLQPRDGDLLVATTGDQSSNRLSSFQQADCLIEVPGASGDLSPGDAVNVLMLDQLLA